jgi:bacteriocin biosynthesis cyclodehydratase domain-containing protein
MPRSPLLRPTLLPGLPRIWRGPHTLQLGLDPARAVLIDMPDPRTARVLDLLDGSRPERLVLARAAELGVSSDDARTLLDTLHAAGFVLAAHALLPSSLADDARHRLIGEAGALALRDAGARTAPAQTLPPRTGSRSAPAQTAPAQATQRGASSPAQVLRRRAAARVVVAGRGRLAAASAVALAQAGVGHVHADLPGAVSRAELAGSPLRGDDVGRPRAEAVTAAVLRAAPDTETRAVRRGAASLVVQLGYDQPVALLAAGHARRRQAHLAVSIREGTAVVGPLVPPAGAPCLNCLDLHRTERDADWPELAAQLGAPAPESCAVATTLAATAYLVAEVVTFLDGGAPETLGAAVEIAAAGRFRRRTWAPHPACGCGRRRRSRRGTDLR